MQESLRPSDGGVNLVGGGDGGTRRCTMQAADMMGMQLDRPKGRGGSNHLLIPGQALSTSTATATLMTPMPEGKEGEVGGSDERGARTSEDLMRMSLVGPDSGSPRDSETVAAGAAAQLLSGAEAASRFGGAIGKVSSVAKINHLALFGAKKSPSPTFEWERPSVLGKAFTRKAKTNFNARKQWRDTAT